MTYLVLGARPRTDIVHTRATIFALAALVTGLALPANGQQDDNMYSLYRDSVGRCIVHISELIDATLSLEADPALAPATAPSLTYEIEWNARAILELTGEVRATHRTMIAMTSNTNVATDLEHARAIEALRKTEEVLREFSALRDAQPDGSKLATEAARLYGNRLDSQSRELLDSGIALLAAPVDEARRPTRIGTFESTLRSQLRQTMSELEGDVRVVAEMNNEPGERVALARKLVRQVFFIEALRRRYAQSLVATTRDIEDARYHAVTRVTEATDLLRQLAGVFQAEDSDAIDQELLERTRAAVDAARTALEY